MTTTLTTSRDRAPSAPLLFTDYGRSLAELSSLLYTWPILAAAPRGDGHPVLVLPGLSTGDGTTVVLRRYLRHLGYEPYGWGLGRNIGPSAKIVSGMRDRLAEIGERHEAPVSLIGWSLGGIFARRLARSTPQSVRQVITLGSPFRLASHDQSHAKLAWRFYSKHHIEELDLPLERGLGPLPVPATSVYSKLDGIVAWRTCLDEPSEEAENVEVYSSHLGYGNHPAVLWVIADRLAQEPGAWLPFRAPAALRWAYRKQR